MSSGHSLGLGDWSGTGHVAMAVLISTTLGMSMSVIDGKEALTCSVQVPRTATAILKPCKNSISRKGRTQKCDQIVPEANLNTIFSAL